MLVLESVRARLPRRESIRFSLRVLDSERLGVRERPPIEGVRSLPTSRYSASDRFQPLQYGQKSHLISQPERHSFWPQLERCADGWQGRTMWYQRWRQESSETLSSATHMLAAAIWVLVGCGGLGVSAVGIY